MNGVACSKNQFEQAMQHFIGSATSKAATSHILKHLRETWKPEDIESRKLIDEIYESLEARTLADP